MRNKTNNTNKIVKPFLKLLKIVIITNFKKKLMRNKPNDTKSLKNRGAFLKLKTNRVRNFLIFLNNFEKSNNIENIFLKQKTDGK